MSTPSGSSLNDAVSQLVRASMGSTIPGSLSNEDLDRHVAELILQEAKLKEERYEELGLRAYIPAKFPDNAAPKPNKRFLSSVIKSTDEHNRTLLRTQALAAADVKARKDEEDRQLRLKRAREAEESRKSRKSRHRSGERHRDSSPSRRHRRKRRERSWERDNDYPDGDGRTHSRRRLPSRSPSSEGHTKGRHSSEERGDHSSRRQKPRRRSMGRSSREPKDGQHRSRKETYSDLDNDGKSRKKARARYEDASEDDRRRRHRQEKSRLLLRGSLSPSPPPNHTDITSTHPIPRNALSDSPPLKDKSPPRMLTKSKFKPIDRPPSPPIASGSSLPQEPAPRSPSPEVRYSSKMDRYFSETYDPRLDTIPLNKKPTVPKDGLIPAEDFEGWDAMLELIQLRRQDKAERKRTGTLDSDSARKKKKKSDRPLNLAWETVEKKRQALSEKEPGVMDIRYQSKGSVREWDMGKVDVDLL